MNDVVHLWTDGSLLKAKDGNTVGGWASVIIRKNKARIIGGFALGRTSNQMEAVAVLEAIRDIQSPAVLHIRTDSAYVKTNIEKIKMGIIPKTNKELWNDILSIISQNTVSVYKIVGHSNNVFNITADIYARYCASNMTTVKESHNGLSLIFKKIKELKT